MIPNCTVYADPSNRKCGDISSNRSGDISFCAVKSEEMQFNVISSNQIVVRKKISFWKNWHTFDGTIATSVEKNIIVRTVQFNKKMGRGSVEETLRHLCMVNDTQIASEKCERDVASSELQTQLTNRNEAISVLWTVRKWIKLRVLPPIVMQPDLETTHKRVSKRSRTL
jgi:hypothetical protein